MTPRGDPQGDDTGAVAIVVALLMTVFLVMAAFAVDIGNAYAQVRQLSVAADADSLAAAAAVGKAMLPGDSCTQDTLTLRGAQAIAQAAADSMNTANNKTGVSEPVNSVTLSCVDNAIEVRVENSRDVKTAIAGIIGISTITPSSYAVARYVRTKSVPGLRPWAVCDKTMQLARSSPYVTFWSGIDNDNGPCSTTAAGNWGAVDFDGGSNPAGDTAKWTRDGYPGPIVIPSTLSADPGVSISSGLTTAFDWLIGKVVPFPTVSGYSGGTGNGATFAAVGVGTVRVCGIVFGNNTYNLDQSTGTTSDCWVNPSPPTGTTTTTTTLSTTTSAPIPVGTNTLAINLVAGKGFPPLPIASNVSVDVSMSKVQLKNKDLNTSVDPTSTSQAVLTVAPDQAIPAGTPITITTTTATGTGGFGPYVYKGNKWNLQNHIQFRWVNYTGSGTYSGSDPVPCALNDQTSSCVGITQLWK